MAFDFQTGDGDKGHGKNQHQEAQHKLQHEVHNIFNKIHHDLQKAKPHVDHIAQVVGDEAKRQAKSYAGSAEREIHGNATPADKHKLETVGKVAATVFLPHVVIGTAVVKTGINLIQNSQHKNVHVEHHQTTVNHGDSKH